MRKKRSFFEKLTGAVDINEEENKIAETNDFNIVGQQPQEIEEIPHIQEAHHVTPQTHQNHQQQVQIHHVEEHEPEEGELAVDVYEDEDSIIIRTMVAGVDPEDIDVSITRDMVTIKGTREEVDDIVGENFFHRELYWGPFSRTILLPKEIEIEESEAASRNGLMVLRLPKIDKDKQTKLKVIPS